MSRSVLTMKTDEIDSDGYGVFTFKLKDNATRVFTLKAGYEYEVTELNADDYVTSWEGTTSGTMTDSHPVTLICTNNPLTFVTVVKQVVGATTTEEFDFTAKFTAYGKIDWTKLAEGVYDGIYKTAIVEDDGIKGFQLGDGKAIDLTGIPAGTEITVYEAAAEGYTTSYSITLNGEEFTDYTVSDEGGVIFTVQPGMVITVTNTALYELPSTGGIGIYWCTIGGGALLMAAALVLYTNRRKEVLRRR